MTLKPRGKLPDAVTLMQHFRASGYSVKGGGKIFHGTKPYDGRSWDDYFVASKGKNPAAVKRDPNLPESAWVPWGPLDCDDGDMFDGKIASRIVSELEKPQEKPFFLAYGLTKPHLSWKVPQKYFDLHPLEGITLPPVKEGDLDDLPVFGKRLAREVYDPSGVKNVATKPDGDHANVIANNQWRVAVQAYLATISFADAQIGRVLDALDRSEHADNTIIVLWGDHGWHLGEKEHWRKHALWDVSTRTPLIFSAPEGFSEKKDLPAACQPDRYLSHAHRPVRPADAGGIRWSESQTPFGKPHAGMGSPGCDDLWIPKLCNPDRALAVYPVPRRRAGTLRPRCRSERVDQPG